MAASTWGVMINSEYNSYRGKLEKIVKLFAARKLSKTAFFDALDSLNSNGKSAVEFGSLGELEAFLLCRYDEYVQSGCIINKKEYEEEVRLTLAHEINHALRIVGYGLTPVYRVIRISYGDFGGEMFTWVPGVSTKEFMHVAPEWTRETILKYLVDTHNIPHASKEDKAMVRACNYL
jgi:hypothetical protein